MLSISSHKLARKYSRQKRALSRTLTHTDRVLSVTPLSSYFSHKSSASPRRTVSTYACHTARPPINTSSERFSFPRSLSLPLASLVDASKHALELHARERLHGVWHLAHDAGDLSSDLGGA